MASVASSHAHVSDSYSIKWIAPAEIDEDLESCIAPRNEEEQEDGSKSARNWVWYNTYNLLIV